MVEEEVLHVSHNCVWCIEVEDPHADTREAADRSRWYFIENDISVESYEEACKYAENDIRERLAEVD